MEVLYMYANLVVEDVFIETVKKFKTNLPFS